MSTLTHSPGETVTVADAEVGDLLFARRDRATQAPKQPVRVTHLHESPFSTRRLVVVVNLYGGGMPWFMGWLEPGRELTRAVPEG